jgi:hypothetical protein
VRVCACVFVFFEGCARVWALGDNFVFVGLWMCVCVHACVCVCVSVCACELVFLEFVHGCECLHISLSLTTEAVNHLRTQPHLQSQMLFTRLSDDLDHPIRNFSKVWADTRACSFSGHSDCIGLSGWSLKPSPKLYASPVLGAYLFENLKLQFSVSASLSLLLLCLVLFCLLRA